MTSTIRTSGHGRTVAVVGDVYRSLATGEDMNGKYALSEAVVPPGDDGPAAIEGREREAAGGCAGIRDHGPRAGALSEREPVTDQRPETYRLLELFRPAAPVILAAFGGVVVWSFHNFGWPGFVLYLLVAFVAGSVTGGWSASPCRRRGR